MRRQPTGPMRSKSRSARSASTPVVNASCLPPDSGSLVTARAAVGHQRFGKVNRIGGVSVIGMRRSLDLPRGDLAGCQPAWPRPVTANHRSRLDEATAPPQHLSSDPLVPRRARVLQCERIPGRAHGLDRSSRSRLLDPGAFEAVELRDGGSEYGGKGVTRAVRGSSMRSSRSCSAMRPMTSAWWTRP